jgi:hypothetical protein
MIDEELKYLVALALRNAFYAAQNSLIANFMKAAEGSDMQVEELLEVHSFGDTETDSDLPPRIYVDWPVDVLGLRGSCGCETVVEGLEVDQAECLYIDGIKMFERQDGEWIYVEDY